MAGETGDVDLPPWLTKEDLDKATEAKKPYVDLSVQIRHPDFGRPMAMGEVADHAKVVRNEKHDYREMVRRGKKLLKDRADMQMNWARHSKASAVNDAEMRSIADISESHFRGDASPEVALVREAADLLRRQENGQLEQFLLNNVDKYNKRGELVRTGVIAPEYARVLLEMPLSRKKSVMIIDAIENSIANKKIAQISSEKASRKDRLTQRKILLDSDMKQNDGDVFDALDARDRRLSDAIAESVDAVKIVRERYSEDAQVFDAITSEIDNIEDSRYRANEAYATGSDEKTKAGADIAMVKMQRSEQRSSKNGDMTLSTQMNLEELSYFALGVAMVREATLESDTRKTVIGQILAEKALKSVNRRIRALATAHDRDPAVADHIVEQMTGRLRQMFTVKSTKAS